MNGPHIHVCVSHPPHPHPQSAQTTCGDEQKLCDICLLMSALRDCVSESMQSRWLLYVHVSMMPPPPPANVYPHLRLHSFRGGVWWIKECVFAYAACCLQEREQSKKRCQRWTKRTRTNPSLWGWWEKGLVWIGEWVKIDRERFQAGSLWG